MNKALKLILCLSLPLIVGGISGYLTAQNVTTWFPTLIKPSFNPPSYLFGPVWTTLYILMGYALYLVSETEVEETKKQKSYLFWTAQLILNFFWSLIFFHWHNIGLALIEIVAMWLMIFITILSFAKVNKKAAWLMVPYISWVSFATILNAAFYYLNK